jgi:hypothetical protein
MVISSHSLIPLVPRAMIQNHLHRRNDIGFNYGRAGGIAKVRLRMPQRLKKLTGQRLPLARVLSWSFGTASHRGCQDHNSYLHLSLRGKKPMVQVSPPLLTNQKFLMTLRRHRTFLTILIIGTLFPVLEPFGTLYNSMMYKYIGSVATRHVFYEGHQWIQTRRSHQPRILASLHSLSDTIHTYLLPSAFLRLYLPSPNYRTKSLMQHY